MVCENYGGVIVCSSPRGVYKQIESRRCPECKTDARAIEQWDGAWYGVTDYCECGDRWQDGYRSERPFRRGWRKEAQADFERMWATAAPSDLYEAYRSADIDTATSDDAEAMAAYERRSEIHQQIMATRDGAA